jgi:hypothetical protein
MMKNEKNGFGKKRIRFIGHQMPRPPLLHDDA